MIEIRSRRTGELVGFYHKPLERHQPWVLLRRLRHASVPYWEKDPPSLTMVVDDIYLVRREAVYEGGAIITYLEVADDKAFDKAPIQYVSRLADLSRKPT
jgi:hypothetical protein